MTGGALGTAGKFARAKNSDSCANGRCDVEWTQKGREDERMGLQ